MKINWKVRIKNPAFWVQLVISVFAPIFAYMGITAEDMTTWQGVGEMLFSAVSNPYVLFLVLVSVYNAVIDPTTYGIGDSKNALSYEEPRKE